MPGKFGENSNVDCSFVYKHFTYILNTYLEIENTGNFVLFSKRSPFLSEGSLALEVGPNLEVALKWPCFRGA